MMKLMGAKRKDRDKLEKVASDKKWWKFSRKTKVKPMRALDIQHNVKFNENHDGSSESYEMSKYVDRDNNHYRRRHHYDDNFMMRTDQSLAGESTRDSLESSEISYQSSNRQNYSHFNQITQNIQNNNNKITIIIKHNEGASTTQPSFAPQIIYIQPAASHPNLHSTNFNQSHNDLENISEVYNSLDDLDSEEHYQFYDERAVDVPDDFKRNSYLVLNFNDAANSKLKRRICTPTRKLLPPEDSQKVKNFNLKNQTIDNHKLHPVAKNTPKREARPTTPKKHQTLNQSKPKTFASQKKLLNEYYNWNVDFPSTTIHHNSILFRDAAQNESFRNKLQIMNKKMMTMGGRGQLGNEFGGSTKELSPRKTKANTLNSLKLVKSEISLNSIKDEQSSGKMSSSLLNLFGIQFNWRSRQLANRSENKDKKKTNMLTNLFKKKRIMCNKR